MPDLSMNLATPISIRGVCAGNARHPKLTLTIYYRPRTHLVLEKDSRLEPYSAVHHAS